MKINGIEVESIEAWTENGCIVIVATMADGSYWNKDISAGDFVFNADHVPEGC